MEHNVLARDVDLHVLAHPAQMDISVVLCTYNQCNLLRSAIESVCQQALSAVRYEIIIVDNASTDQTRNVVAEAKELYPRHQIRYVYEAVPGLANARNTGLGEARAPLIAYMDDDAKASPEWLKRVLEVVSNIGELPICIGGPIIPFYTTPKPEWFLDSYEARTWGEQPRWLKPSESFSGSNMIWDKKILASAGGFDARRGVKGQLLSLGEETAVFETIWRENSSARFFYDPSLVVAHWVPPKKMTVEYRLRRSYVRGRDQVREILRGRNYQSRLHLTTGFSILLAKSFVLALARVKRYKSWQQWAVEECKACVYHAARVVTALGIDIEIRQR